MSDERKVGHYSAESVADGWLKAELGKTTTYRLDTLARPGFDATALDVDSIKHRHVEKFWAQDQDPMARAKWLIGKRSGKAWDRFKKWYNDNPLVLIPRVDIDTSGHVAEEAYVYELCKDKGIPTTVANAAIRRGHLKAWKPPKVPWRTHKGVFNAWYEHKYLPEAKRRAKGQAEGEAA